MGNGPPYGRTTGRALVSTAGAKEKEWSLPRRVPHRTIAVAESGPTRASTLHAEHGEAALRVEERDSLLAQASGKYSPGAWHLRLTRKSVVIDQILPDAHRVAAPR